MNINQNKNGFEYNLDVFEEQGAGYAFESVVYNDKQTVEEEVKAGRIKINEDVRFMEIVEGDVIEITQDADVGFDTFVTCDNLAVSGNAVFEDNVLVETMSVFGNAEVNGKINADFIFSEGKLSVDGKINSLRISVYGQLSARNTISFEKCIVKGRISASGFVKGIDMKINADGKHKMSKLRRVAADNFTVSGDKGEEPFIVSCREVSCGNAKLVNAKIDYLICDECEIGEGCRIGTLECRGNAKISFLSQVDKIAEDINSNDGGIESEENY